MGDLKEITLCLQIALGNIVIFTILTLPIQEHDISFHLLISLSSFFSILQFSEYRSFSSIGRVISRRLILFDAMVNEIASLVSLSALSLLVSRNVRDFCVLIFLYCNFTEFID